jgi:hypothetical protein
VTDRAVNLKRTLLAFWAVWFTVVFATNLFDAAKAANLLPEAWAVASGNYRYIVETTSRYGTPQWTNVLLFLGVLCWEGIATTMFWLACWRYRGKGIGGQTVYAAFFWGLTLWAAFLVADEVFIAYAVEATHLRLFTAQLVTLVAIEVLPEERRA